VRFSCAVPCLAVFWADGEGASDDGMAVVGGKWAQEGEVGGRDHLQFSVTCGPAI